MDRSRDLEFYFGLLLLFQGLVLEVPCTSTVCQRQQRSQFHQYSTAQQPIMSDAPRRGRGRPVTRTAEEKRLAKQQYNQERYRKLTTKPESDNNNQAPPIPSVGAIPLRTAPKRASPPSPYVNTFPQFASPKKTPPQAPSPKKMPPQAPSQRGLN
jgi:hypothetical protein